MTAQVFRVEDPRDRLSKATRDELVAFAHSRGQMDISEMMPATRICEILRERNMIDINIPERPLGSFIPKEMYGVIDAPAQELQAPKVKTTQAINPDAMSIQELRKTLKAMGVKTERTDNLAKLREKLRGHQNAA